MQKTICFRIGRYLGIAALAFGLCLTAEPAFSTDTVLPAVFQKLAPEGAADLSELEQVTRDLAEHAIECTVCVEVGAAMGSGVIVSEDGYVLTAAHVTGAPGRNVRIILHDGTRLEGKTLGIHTQADGGLIKITSQGKWSHAPLVPEDEAPQMGDWCLATGHPGGFQPERGTPIRLGRAETERRRLAAGERLERLRSAFAGFGVDPLLIGTTERTAILDAFLGWAAARAAAAGARA